MQRNQNQPSRRELADAVRKLWAAPVLTVLLSASQQLADASSRPSGGFESQRRPVATDCKKAGLTAGVDCYDAR